MTVPSQPTVFQHTANGVTTVFAYDCLVLDADDLKVYLDGVLQNSGYVVNGVGTDSGGTVTFSVAPASAVVVTLSREVALERETDYQNNGDFRAPTVNADFDRIWMALQQFWDRIGRSIRVSTFDPTPTSDLILPTAPDRANQYLVFDASGRVSVASGTGADSGLRDDLSNASNVLQGDALVAVLRTETGAVAATQHDVNQWRALNVLDFMTDAQRTDVLTRAGALDVTAPIQAAADALRAAGGGILDFPVRGLCVINKNIVIPTNTTVRLNGSTLRASQTGFIGTQANNDCYLLRNYNHQVSSLTDENIVIENGILDYGNVVVSGGGAHAISMRYVNRVTVRGVIGLKGENVTALLACRDTLVENCHGVDQINCFFDHWDGAGNCKVIACTGRSSVDIAQGIQFTGTGSNLENRTSIDAVVAFCSLYGVRNSVSHSASAIISNANDADSATYRFRSIGNYISNSDMGIVFEGEGGQHTSLNDTLHSVDQLPIFIQTQNSDNPDNCRVLYPHLIDCSHSVPNVAMISVSGVGNSIRGLKVTNSGAAAYGQIIWLTSNATDTLVEIESAPTGTTGRIQNNGVNTHLIDTFDRYEEGSYTPALTFGNAAVGMTYAARSGNFVRVGDMCFINGSIQLSAKGSSTGAARLNLPFTSGAYPFAGMLSTGTVFNMASLTSPPVASIGSSESVVVLNDFGATGTANLDDTNFTNTTFFYFSGWYKTAT